jgi:hypothetical protein
MTPTSPGPADDCHGDWTELIDQIASTNVAPDVVLLQQMSGKGSGTSPVETVESALTARFPQATYNTIVAEAQPGTYPSANCPDKLHQTNGILYRTQRLDYTAGTKKTLMAMIKTAAGCKPAGLSRNLAVFAKFLDKVSGHEVALGSVHWPVTDGCGPMNGELTDGVMTSYTGAQLFVWGGDINLPDRDAGGWYPWYATVNGEVGGALGYRDAIYQACGGQLGCLEQNVTLLKVRYDFLFTKYNGAYKGGLPNTSDAWTPPWDPDGDGLRYSQHRAVKAYVYW